MERLIRFGVSLPKELLIKFDRFIREKNYSNRSKAIGDLIREVLVKKEWFEGKEVAGAITLIYNHHKDELLDSLINIQHKFEKMIISTQHIHLDGDNCLEIIAVRGKPQEVQKLADNLKVLKGVKHSTLSMSSTGKEIV
ncbi:MAG: nickel-responsive transcriptional regulator NikR [Candidatus Omnitrophica bacterium]|nr:nickel-responsive transcriptional regulator NikR [Candidatus Omnitrophota bacterium]